MALTILDMARLRDDEYEQGILETFALESNLMAELSFETLNAVSVNTRRMNALPNSVGFRARGESYTQGSVGIDTVTDSVYPLGAEIEIDKMDMKDKSPFVDPLTFHTQAHVKALAYVFNYNAVAGDRAVTIRGFDGIKARIGNLASSQTVYANTASAELDVRAAASPANATLFQWLDRIEDAIYAVDGHKADLGLTDGDFLRRLRSVLRQLNVNVEQVDNAKTTLINQRGTNATPAKSSALYVPMWDIKFIDMGTQVDQSTAIVATDTINALACRPLYLVRLGEPYLQGIQEYPMEVSKPFMKDDGVTWKTVIDWPVGFRHVHPKFGAVLKGTRVA